MTTVDIFPLISSGKEEEEKDYNGPTPGELLEPLFEEKETGQETNIQEYCLGKMMIKNPFSDPEQETHYTYKNIEEQMTLCYPVEMGNGTPCSFRPSSSTVMYTCHPQAKHEMLSLAKITTGEYKVIILTPLLRSDPK
ncbi:PREDICTED: LOW QUALITY PROTEIN: endoplasmic reticulum lectin 1-like [Tinamus guttatus]|uniref:LOW QUALITY PROTEIN: endoplasmic reticulum lectin 1-like n=1 Tax=Tinamus guttatus TaxID=94827 RepID=UPI00052E6A6C|nr:PREDICTED: LOW QUALITY PROTEIN: endoplasmic reticulum lectin 1-like [Tinamus guttatus]